MSAAEVSRCGTVCEAFYFDPAFTVSTARTLDQDDAVVSRPVTSCMGEFARRSQDHMAVAMFMGQLTHNRLVTVAVSLRMDLTGEHLPYPANFVAAKLRALSPEDRDEAWELFGDGVQP
jgi:hypothetical protein